MTSSANTARDNKRRLAAIQKQVSESWESSRNPNCFGGAPVMDPTGKIIAIDVSAFGIVAEAFEDDYIQEKLLEAFRKNNVHYNGLEQEEIEGGIKSSVEASPPKPDVPIFMLKAYGVQSYLSQLVRHVNKLSRREVPGGLQWGLASRDAQVPEGWRDDFLEFSKYGGPGTSYEGSGKLTPRVRDLICHYFYLLGLDANDFCKSKPADYKERDMSKLTFLPPPAEFNVPRWSILFDGETERPSNSNKRRREQTTSSQSSESESEVQEEEGEPEEDEEAEGPRPRIVLHIQRSRISKPGGHSKPPKKTAKKTANRPLVHCLECGEPETDVDLRMKNGFVPCSDHQAHKYCQQACIDNHDIY